MTTSMAIVGNLTADPELRFTASGKAVASLRIAVSERIRDADGTWKDGDATFWKVTAWDRLAEHIGDSLAKGQRIIVIGKVASRTYETREGEKRTEYEVTASALGPDLLWDTVKVSKASKGGGKATPAAADDPWAHGAVGLDEVPF